MSPELNILTLTIALLASIALIRPAALFAYPVATSLLMWFFLLPQAWLIESTGDLDDFQPTIAWVYIILCMLMTAIGFQVGTSRATGTAKNGLQQFSAEYDFNKLFIGACALVAIGGAAFILMARAAAQFTGTGGWTGVLAFYVMLTSLVIFGTSLSWIIFLYTRRKLAFVLTAIGIATTLPTILFAARRELSFSVAAIILLGIFFVKKKSLSRIVLIPLLLVGSILINQAGQIRGFISHNDASLFDALGDQQVTDTSKSRTYAEMGSGVSDIAIASWSNSYTYIAPYYNQLIISYVPAFIVGYGIKNGLQIETDTPTNAQSAYFVNGATRTGFSDSFLALHYFGCLIYFLIAYFMGLLWAKAKLGDIKSQIYYMILLASGLKTFTESTSSFIVLIPILFLSMGAVFKYARRPVGRPAPASTDVQLPTTRPTGSARPLNQ